MNFRKAFELQEDSFQIAPLIDVVFLLLIFFIVTGALAAQEKETPLELPETTSAVARRREKLDIVVNIDRAGTIWIYNQEYSVENLRTVLLDLRGSARLTPVSVIIRADGRSLHRDVVKVLDACSAADLKNVSFVSVNAAKKPIK